MKFEYIDQYGVDSLPQLRIASRNLCGIFLTSNESLLKDRVELEKAFNLRIMTPKEFSEENK